MKKLFLGVLSLLCFGFLAVAQDDVPVFDGPNANAALVIDIKAHSTAKDLMVLVDQVSNEPKNFRLYVWNKNKGWKEDDDLLELKRFNDTARFGRYRIPLVGSVGKSIQAYKYIAIVPADGSKYKYKLLVRSHDLYVFAQPLNTSFRALGKGATEIDISGVNAKANDNIKLISATDKTSNVGFYIFGDRGEGFELLGTTYLKANKDAAFVDLSVENAPKEYSTLAIVSTDGKQYSYSVVAKGKDLHITVGD